MRGKPYSFYNIFDFFFVDLGIVGSIKDRERISKIDRWKITLVIIHTIVY